jgi:hypothetical protein
LIALSFALALSSFAPPVLPEPDAEPAVAIELEWAAPDGCPTTDDVRRAIAGLLARRVDLDPTATVVARGDIERAGAGFRLRLSVDTAESTESRELEAERCDVLGEAAALIVATGIDPARVAARVHEQEVAPTATPAPTVQDDRAAKPAAAAAPATSAKPDERKRLRPRGAINIVSGPAIGLVPSVAAWLGGDVVVQLGRARFGGTVGHAFARPTGGDDEVGARVSLTSAGVIGCFVPSWRKVSLVACGVAEAGAMRASGEGPGVDPTTQQALWVGLGLRTGVEWAPLRWLALVAQVDVLAAARRPGFHVAQPGDEPQQVFRASPASLRVALGLSFRFP